MSDHGSCFNEHDGLFLQQQIMVVAETGNVLGKMLISSYYCNIGDAHDAP